MHKFYGRIKGMKNLFLVIFEVFFFFALAAGFSVSEKKYKTVTVELPRETGVLFSTFYCFNDLETGRALAEELYGIKNLDEILKAGGFKKLMAIPVGSEIAAFNFAIMTHNREFWFFENRDDGWLWGTGRY